MNSRTLLVIALGAGLLLPAMGVAGPPGADTILSATAQCVRFVHDDAPENGVRDPGENTTCATPTVDDSVSPAIVRDGEGGPRCVHATVGALRGLVTMLADDDARDNASNEGSVLALLFEIRSGERVFAFADAYASAGTLDALDIGWWDGRIFEEGVIFSTGFLGASFLFGALAPIRERLLAIGDELGLIANADGFEPVIVDPQRDAARKSFARSTEAAPGACNGSDCGLLEAAESAGPLASLAQYRVTIQFAEKASPGSGPCSTALSP